MPKEIHYEGFWVTRGIINNKFHSSPEVSVDPWFYIKKSQIVTSLSKIESIIRAFKVDNIHNCSICHALIPLEEYTCSSPTNSTSIYSWPNYLHHYIKEHDICPTNGFLKDILNIDKKESEDPNETIFRIWQALNAKDKQAFLDKVSALRSSIQD